MLKRLSLIDLHVAIKKLIEEHSDLKLLDGVGLNEVSPFTYFEIVDMQPANTKTMYVDKFTIHIHVISKAEENNSSVPHYENIQKVEEVFTKRMELPEPFDLFRQANEGMISNFTEETNEKHAVLAFSFWVAYGFKIK